jgi:hypothetical protein
VARQSGVATTRNVTISVAVLTVITLTFVLILSSVEGSSSIYTSGGQSNGQVSKSVGTSVVTAGGAAAGCTAPAPVTPQPTAPSFLGPPSFTFVGANSACITVSPSTSGQSSSDVSYTLNAPKSTFLTLQIGTPATGGTALPPGINFTATVGSQSFIVQEGSDPFYATPLLMVPSGETAFQIKVSVPNPYQVGTYEFMILIAAFQDSSQTFETYSTYLPVNIVAQ